MVERLVRRTGGSSGDQHFLPECQRRRIAFGQNPKSVEDITKEIKRVAKQPVIMKLSPNVTDITENSKGSRSRRCRCTFSDQYTDRLKIDINRRKICPGKQDGGMSGPAVNGCRGMVYQTAQAVKLPIIGMGGIMNAEDAWSSFWQEQLPFL